MITNKLSNKDISSVAVAHPGFLIFMRNGRQLPTKNGGTPYNLAPRTAFGISRNGRYLYVLIVDGRQPNYSLGASMTDLFRMMKAAGAYNAINMDGGGSTTLVYHDVGLNETFIPNKHKNRNNYRKVGISVGFWFDKK